MNSSRTQITVEGSCHKVWRRGQKGFNWVTKTSQRKKGQVTSNPFHPDLFDTEGPPGVMGNKETCSFYY